MLMSDPITLKLKLIKIKESTLYLAANDIFIIIIMIKKTIHLVCFEMYKVRNVEGGMLKLNLLENLNLIVI